jgi:hypothetical protein
MKLTIPRSIWLRGEGDEVSRLLRPEDDKMCCIGIYLKELGVEEEYLLNVSDANHINFNHRLPEEAKWLRDPCAVPSSGSFYTTNDYELLNIDEDSESRGFVRSEEEREAKIREMFLAHGVEVTFVD